MDTPLTRMRPPKTRVRDPRSPGRARTTGRKFEQEGQRLIVGVARPTPVMEEPSVDKIPRVVRRHAANISVAVPPHAQSLASRDGDEWREGADSISEMLFLAAELHLVLPCSRDHVEAQGKVS